MIVVGGGAAGLYAAYNLKHRNIEFEILEASSTIGGRVKETRDFVDFPIDLGGEWIHTHPRILQDMLLLGEQLDRFRFETVDFNPKTWGTYSNGKNYQRNILRFFYGEWKYKRDTWFGYLSTYILPKVQHHIRTQAVVNHIRYDGPFVVVQTTDGREFRADKVIMTVPLSVMQSDDIKFIPPLPDKKTHALMDGAMQPAMKCFIEFSERFYPDQQLTHSMFQAYVTMSGEEIFYDAAFKKDTKRNVLGFFCEADPAQKYTSMESDEEIFANLMKQLDEMFDGKASRYYIKHHVENWPKAPYIRGGYSVSGLRSPNKARKPVDNKVYFAGEYLAPYQNKSWISTVHGAMISGQMAVKAVCDEGGVRRPKPKRSSTSSEEWLVALG